MLEAKSVCFFFTAQISIHTKESAAPKQVSIGIERNTCLYVDNKCVTEQ